MVDAFFSRGVFLRAVVFALVLAIAGCGGSGSSSGSGGGGGGSGRTVKSANSIDEVGTGGTNLGNFTPNGSPACGVPVSLSLTDPLFSHQWYIQNIGQQVFANFGGNSNEDIHLCGSTPPRGAGVTVAVVDTGVEAGHEDLLGQVEIGVTTPPDPTSHNFRTGLRDPTNTVTGGDHGTSVAGLIGAADNGLGINGIAAGVTLVGYNLLGAGVSGTNGQEALSLGAAMYSAGVDIFNQSWGFNLYDAYNAADLNPDAEDNYFDGVTNLRAGKGAIYVKSSGNGFYTDYGYAGECPTALLTCQNSNMEPYSVIPYQIVVGAVNAYGFKSSYSTAGSSLWVSAPGGEFGYNTSKGWAAPPDNPDYVFEPAMITTDQSGCVVGYSQAPPPSPANPFQDNSNGLNVGCNYTSTFNGTSSAAPVTSAVIALMLGVEPNLTWRDVKHILAKTSRKIDAAFPPVTLNLLDGPYDAEPGWIDNAASGGNGGPYHFHNWYGFGRVDADAAITMATGFIPNGFGDITPFDDLLDTGFLAKTVNAAVPDQRQAGVTSTRTVTGTGMSFIEAVQVKVNVKHPYPGDLGIELTHVETGTRSVLLNIRNGLGGSKQNLENWVLLSNAFYGEDPDGNWTIKVLDGSAGDTGTFQNWSIRILGH